MIEIIRRASGYSKRFYELQLQLQLELELELELIQAQMAQKPMLPAEVYARAGLRCKQTDRFRISYFVIRTKLLIGTARQTENNDKRAPWFVFKLQASVRFNNYRGVRARPKQEHPLRCQF